MITLDLFHKIGASSLKVRENGRVRSMAAVVAINVRATGEREVLGLAGDGAFWLTQNGWGANVSSDRLFKGIGGKPLERLSKKYGWK